MSSFEKSVVTGVLVRRADGRFLLVKKVSGVGPYANMYLPPGGGVDDGERIDDAVQRELYEETGVRVKNLRRVIFDDDITENWQGVKRHFIGLLYMADYVSGDLEPTDGNDDEFEHVGWFSVEEMKALPLSPPARRLLLALGLVG